MKVKITRRYNDTHLKCKPIVGNEYTVPDKHGLKLINAGVAVETRATPGNSAAKVDEPKDD